MSWYELAKKRMMLKRNTLKKARYGKKGWIQDQLSREKLLRNVSIMALASVVGGSLMVGLVFAWYARDLPQPDRIVRREGFSTKIMDRSEELLYEIFVDQQRTPITLDQTPESLRQATIAIEDKHFYTHGGFDPKGILRAAVNTIFLGNKQGGSTLTQQLVKNVLLTSERRLSRKIKEFILSIQIESKYNKDEILQMYLNEAPYGGTAWGVATAAQTYFGKNVSDLDLMESAILAGLPQRPSAYSPFGSTPEAYKGRTREVLRRMREDGYITVEEEQETIERLDNFEFSRRLTSIKAPHFVLFVKDQLEDMFGQQLVEQGGLRVTTSLDYGFHSKVQEIVTEEIEKVADAGIGNGAAMVMDPSTGEIISMVGSKNFFDEDYDGQVNVALSMRQPGSAIKPVTYAAGFEKGYTPAHPLMDVATDFPGSSPTDFYRPVNYDGKYRGPIQLRFALGSSLNVPAVKLLALVGLEDMLNLAYDMGIKSFEPTRQNMQRFGLAVTLGGAEVRLLDLTTAYSSFANGGIKVDPVSILKVEDRDGLVLYEHRVINGKRVISEGSAFLINHILSDNNARLLTFGANSFLNMGGRPVAVKTGTTNDKRDNWTMGWSTSGIVGVWVGNNDNSPMKQVASGITGASPIWRRIILEWLDEYPAEAWPIPDNVEAVMVDAVSGYPEHSGYPARSEYVVRGTLQSLPDPVHTELKLCKGQDRLATAVQVEREEYDEKEFFVFIEDVILSPAPSWQEGIYQWSMSQEDARYKAPTEYCDSDESILVRLEEPRDKRDIDGDEVRVRVRVVSQDEVDRVEVYVDGSRKETLTSRPFETTLKLAPGTYKIRAMARLKNGKEAESGESRIGVGGVPWEGIQPTETPTPTPGITMSPAPTLTLIPEEED